MLIATDLDGTFLAGDAEARQRLYQLISGHPEITLVFVTGRGLEAVLPILSDPTIPIPDYIISDVGATVVEGRSCQAVHPLQSAIEANWPGELAVMEAMSGFGRLQRQEVPQQRRCSFFCEGDAVTEEILAAARTLGCDVLYSADRYLDILPGGVNKGSTLRALVAHLGIDPERVLVAGDTLNDLSMYEQGFMAYAWASRSRRCSPPPRTGRGCCIPTTWAAAASWRRWATSTSSAGPAWKRRSVPPTTAASPTW